MTLTSHRFREPSTRAMDPKLLECTDQQDLHMHVCTHTQMQQRTQTRLPTLYFVQ